MTGFFMKATAALTLGAATFVATATPAEARRYWGGDRYHRNHDRTGTAIAAGVVGLAIGAALASSSRDRYYRGYDGYDGYNYDRPRRYYRPYRDRGYYRGCYTRRVYDPYIGRRVRVRYCD